MTSSGTTLPRVDQIEHTDRAATLELGIRRLLEYNNAIRANIQARRDQQRMLRKRRDPQYHAVWHAEYEAKIQMLDTQCTCLLAILDGHPTSKIPTV